MNKKYYLLRYDTSFYDGHGCPDDGGTTFKVEHTEKYNDWDLTKLYGEDGEILEDDYDEDFSEQDGYNYYHTTFCIKEITKDEFDNYSKILEDYDKLMNLEFF